MSKSYPEWTPAWLAALPVEGAARNERDPKTPGLWFRKTAAGGMTWRWTRALRDGKTQTITLGTFAHPPYPGSMTINDARAVKGRLHEAHAQSLKMPEAVGEAFFAAALERERDLFRAAAEEAAPELPPPEGKVFTVRQAFEEWYESRLCSGMLRRKRPESAKRMFDKDVLPYIGSKVTGEVTREDLRQLIRYVTKAAPGSWRAKEGAPAAPVMGGHLLKLLKEFFRWCDGEDRLLDASGRPVRNPAALLAPENLGVERPDKPLRALTPDEIATFWRGLDDSKMLPQTKAALRILLLLGVRQGELLLAEKRELDLESPEPTWTVPEAHRKLTRAMILNKQGGPMVYPLSPLLVEQFRVLLATSPRDCKWLLTSAAARADVRESGQPYGETTLNRMLSILTRGRGPLPAATERRRDGTVRHRPARPARPPSIDLPGGSLTVHDLRKTFSTRLRDERFTKAGIRGEIVERCLSHVGGAIEGLYNLNNYLPQRREAILAWSAYMRELVYSNVVSIQGKAA